MPKKKKKRKAKKKKIIKRKKISKKKVEQNVEKELVYKTKKDWISKATVNKSQYEKKYKASLSDNDGFVLCLAPRWQAELALESVLLRARTAWHRIPQEVRNVVIRKGAPDDGTTAPMRPLPGGARMYPETDIPTQSIDNQKSNQPTIRTIYSNRPKIKHMNPTRTKFNPKLEILSRLNKHQLEIKDINPNRT